MRALDRFYTAADFILLLWLILVLHIELFSAFVEIARHGHALLPDVLPPAHLLVCRQLWVPHRLNVRCDRTLTTRPVSRQCCSMTQHRCGVHESVTWSVAWPRRSGCFTRSTLWSSPCDPCQPRRQPRQLRQPLPAIGNRNCTWTPCPSNIGRILMWLHG